MTFQFSPKYVRINLEELQLLQKIDKQCKKGELGEILPNERYAADTLSKMGFLEYQHTGGLYAVPTTYGKYVSQKGRLTYSKLELLGWSEECRRN